MAGDSSVNKVTIYWLEDRGFLSSPPRPDRLDYSRIRIHWILVDLSSRIKRPDRTADNSYTSNAMDWNSFNFTSPVVFMAWCLHTVMYSI
jgi:hypothetical protein